MSDTSARMLRLLALLQGRGEWTGGELARRLEVGQRTVRRDIDRLRELGYSVAATRGPDGGYRLTGAAAMPPLLLDDEESVAIAVALATAARAPVAGIAEAVPRAMAKLQQVMPPQLRARVAALAETTVSVAPDTPAPAVSPDAVAALSSAARDRLVVRFDYADRDGRESLRRAEPYRLVVWDRRWYLLAWDLDRRDWRRFRVDRVGRVRMPAGPRFSPRELRADVAASVARDVTAASYRVRARVVVHAPAEVVAARIPPAVGPVEALGPNHCALEAGADSYETLAAHLGLLDYDFEVTGPAELTAAVRAVAARYARAVGGS